MIGGQPWNDKRHEVIRLADDTLPVFGQRWLLTAVSTHRSIRGLRKACPATGLLAFPRVIARLRTDCSWALCIESFCVDFRCVHLFQVLNVCDQDVSFPDSPRVQRISEEYIWQDFWAELTQSRQVFSRKRVIFYHGSKRNNRAIEKVLRTASHEVSSHQTGNLGCFADGSNIPWKVDWTSAWLAATTVALGGLMEHDLGTQDKALSQWISLRPGRPRTNDRDDMGSATSSGGNNSRFPIQQRHRIDAASNWTAMINFILHRWIAWNGPAIIDCRIWVRVEAAARTTLRIKTTACSCSVQRCACPVGVRRETILRFRWLIIVFIRVGVGWHSNCRHFSGRHSSRRHFNGRHFS